MTEQNLPPDTADDDTEGHRMRRDAGGDDDRQRDDTEGHSMGRPRRGDDDTDDDTQGHMRKA